MVMAGIVLIISAALFMFYLQSLCEKILRQEFKHSYSAFLIHTASLEFLDVRRKLAATEGDFDYARMTSALECDYQVAINLLKNFESKGLRRKIQNSLLKCYFRAVTYSLSPCRALGFTGKSSLLKMTDILQYFSSTIGQQMSVARAQAVAVPLSM